MPSEDILFPYMVWAHERSARTKHCLTQSGLAQADDAFLRELGVDIGHPSREALPALEEALARLFDVPRSRVIVTLGASGGMHLAALRWFRRGSTVVTERPSYEPFRALPRLFGARTLEVERSIDQGWALDLQRIRDGLAAARPGHVFVANPHNPTGALLDGAELAQLGRLAAQAGGVLVSCEVYMEFAPRGQGVHAFRAAPNGVSIGSLTKAYGLGALRMGWMILGEELEAERAAIVDMAYLTYVDPPTVALRAARVALGCLPALLAPLATIDRENRPLWEHWLTHTNGVQATLPRYGIIAFPRIAGVRDTHALGEYLVREHDVDVVPGEFFGAPGHLRLGCGAPRAQLEEGLARLERGIAAFRAL